MDDWSVYTGETPKILLINIFSLAQEYTWQCWSVNDIFLDKFLEPCK